MAAKKLHKCRYKRLGIDKTVLSGITLHISYVIGIENSLFQYRSDQYGYLLIIQKWNVSKE